MECTADLTLKCETAWCSSQSCVYATRLISKASWDLLAALGCVKIITKSSEATFELFLSHKPKFFSPLEHEGMKHVLAFYSPADCGL